jgi:sporulation protein YabP
MENSKGTKLQQNHSLHINNRESMDLTGVIRVVTFNEENVVLQTSMGGLSIKGKAMKVNKLNVDNGEMSIEGYVYSIFYNDKDSVNKEKLLKKLFK